MPNLSTLNSSQLSASEVLLVGDQYYILASSSLADDRSRVLKHGDTFAIFDRRGDVYPVGLGEQGVFHEGTRFLSRLVLRLGIERPLLLSSTVHEDNAVLTVDMMNPEIRRDGDVMIAGGEVHISRSKFLWQGCCHERIHVCNYGIVPVTIKIALDFDADFADIFEVRGMQRKGRGVLEREVVESGAVITYHGRDGVTRRARLLFDPWPESLSESSVEFVARLQPKGTQDMHVTLVCERDGSAPLVLGWQKAMAQASRAIHQQREQDCVIETSNEQFNDWLRRSRADLHLMVTDTPYGAYPYAGVPWFSTPFGRDGIITALQCLTVNPSVARGVLQYLAATQATELDEAREAEPGKILHETRLGEMAALGEIPFGLYYGTVDATPLFVVLAGEYYRRTADLDLVRSLWPNVRAALAWIDDYGMSDANGFVSYARRTASGLVNQGWKDSVDPISHQDGVLADAPIALCEVQGYAYDAWMHGAILAEALGDPVTALVLRGKAGDLQARFEKAFWCEEMGTYAIALDGNGKPCCIRSSNAGHCLYSGIVSPERARRVAQSLMAEDMYSGWGIRTLSTLEVRYNPMSYHNGSVWPHDTALVAAGFARYALKREALRVLTGLFEASQYMELHRLPELFSGFPKRPGDGPTAYPVACSPQAWAVGSIYMLLESCLGLRVQAPGKLLLDRPQLPPWLDEVGIRGLRVGTASVDLLCRRYPTDVGVTVLRRDGDLEIVLTK